MNMFVPQQHTYKACTHGHLWARQAWTRLLFRCAPRGIDKILRKLREIQIIYSNPRVTAVKDRFLRCALPSFAWLCLVGCTKTCVGVPELGSKKRPLRVALTAPSLPKDFEPKTQALANCIETHVGYRVSFQKVSDPIDTLEKLRSQNLEFAAVPPLPYLSAPEGLKILMMSTKDPQQPLRSVLVGPGKLWQNSVTPSLMIPNRNNVDAAIRRKAQLRVVYTSPQSEWGFLVPRQMFLDEQIYPTQALFAGNEDMVLGAIQQNLADIGAVSSDFLQQRFPEQFRARVGSPLGNLIVLGMSGPLPTELMVYRDSLTQKIQDRFETGLTICAQLKPETIETLFYGQEFVKPKTRLLLPLQDIIDFQKWHPLVFAPDESQPLEKTNSEEAEPYPE